MWHVKAAPEMTDQYAANTPLGAFTRRDGPRTPDGRTRFSYDHGETGEPSTIGALLSVPTSPDRPLAFSDDETLPRFNSKSREQGGRQGGRERRIRRIQKPQSSGAFLLQDAVVGDEDNTQQRRQPRYTSSKGKELLEPLSSSLPREIGLGIGSGNGLRPRIISPDTSQEDLMPRKRDGARGGSKQHQGQSTLDVDSTQIVNMALNLSESRRIASRRNFTRTNPPRLAPMQDVNTGNNIKAHLQQQRKTSRAISPRPHQALTPRLSGVRSSSPLRPSYEPGHDASYRYHFSTSTLSRAQKAREHLELMAQYRRLLEILPPLKMGYDRSSATSPPGSPTNGRAMKFGASGTGPAIGRQYNPLQYIRNRKVRARERKGIDGDTQGFGDVESVKLWIERASERASSTDRLSGGSFTLPTFPTADHADAQAPPDPSSKIRTRRPRVDWFFEPSDMIADAYWLEKDNHKLLIEDRNREKIYPQNTELTRPMSRQNDDPELGITPFSTKTLEDVEGEHGKEFKLNRPDTDNSQGSSARDRAKQKLHDLGGFHRHHHNNPSHSHHDFLRMRRGSDSSLSSSDDEAKLEGISRKRRPIRAGTLSSNTNDLLQKQMLEMLAQEAKEQQTPKPLENRTEYIQHRSSNTPDRVPISNPSSNTKVSLTDQSDSDHRSIRGKMQMDSLPHYQFGRSDLPSSGRKRTDAADIDSPQPMSPELTAQDNLYTVPTGLDLSAPSSRSSSPSRNPFSKVKQIFRDKTKEDGETPPIQTEESEPTSRRPSIPEPFGLVESKSFPESRPPPTRPVEGHRYQRSTNSARLRGDESVGLRGMFKGPRIDTVIRGGVSRLGDMLWKSREPSAENPADALSTDESDNEQRGRPRMSLTLSRTTSRRGRNEPQNAPKHFLDTMPQFQPLAEVQNKNAVSNHQRANSELAKIQTSQTNQPSRFEALKPPKLDMEQPPSTVVPPIKVSRYADVEMSESESNRDSFPDGGKAKDMDFNSMLVPGFHQRGRAPSRHWSITDQESPNAGQLSRRDIARLRALILTSGIKAMEISRRAQEPKKCLFNGLEDPGRPARFSISGVPWSDIAKLAPKEALPQHEEAPACDQFPLASRTLGITIQTNVQRWQVSADRFQNQTRSHLDKRIWRVRSRIADDLSGMTGQASDQADETSKDLAMGQRLKVKHVVDIIENLSRNRRRRFRWIRRGLWVAVEWVLVGFMWYVWFVVMIFRVILGLGQGTWRGVKWLLWL